MASNASLLATHEADYISACTDNRAFALDPDPGFDSELFNGLFGDIYEDNFSRSSSSGRKYYDQIRGGADVCPLCAMRDVSSLDHYLPKEIYPGLAITPANLVPSCFECNNSKGTYRPRTDGQQLLHPYFDRIEGIWLRAEVRELSPPTLKFDVETTHAMHERLSSHLKVFGLRRTFGIFAGQDLGLIRDELQNALRRFGPEGVRRHVETILLPRYRLFPNEWQAASYRALAASSWFCSEGVLLIPEPTVYT